MLESLLLPLSSVFACVCGFLVVVVVVCLCGNLRAFLIVYRVLHSMYMYNSYANHKKVFDSELNKYSVTWDIFVLSVL